MNDHNDAASSVVVEHLVHRAADGYPMHYVTYRPRNPTALVIFLHGIQSHSGWYEASCRQLAEAGCVTLFLDRRGSGRNEQDRGDAKNTDQLITDVIDFVQARRKENPQLPTLLAGISWGGKIALSVIARTPDIVEGAAFLCPGWFAKIGPSLRERLAIGWSSVLWPKRMIRVPLSEPSLFTAEPSAQQFIADDPMALRRATARLLMGSKRLDFGLKKLPQHVHIPTLLMLAGQDRIIDNDRTRALYSQFKGDRTIHEYPNAHHTLEFEADARQIFGDLITWLEAWRQSAGARST